MTHWYLALASLLTVGLTSTWAAGPLTIGSPAPELKINTWVKGEPVARIEKNKIYVVEFWGTNCAPCIRCMPHLTEIQRKHKDVVFVSLSDEPEQEIRDFVAKHDKEMGFRVGYDAKALMWKAWMVAADMEGIPTAFIVDATGKIAWIGDPSKIDEPLQQILAGKFDPELDIFRLRLHAAAKKQGKIEDERLNLYNKVAIKVEELTVQGKWGAARALVEEALRDPKISSNDISDLKLFVLAGDPRAANEAVDYATNRAAVIRSTLGNDSISHSRSYFSMARSLMQGYSTSPDPRFADLAIVLIEWSIEDFRWMASEKERLELEYEMHQTQALAHARRKRFSKAVTHQELALALFPKINPQNRIKGWRPIEEGQLKATLAEYQKGLAGAGE